MFVYHIREPGMDLSEGYIGVSKCPEKRFKAHRHSRENFLLRDKIKGGNTSMVILLESDEEYCLHVENSLRPMDNVGWNRVAGGGLPPVEKSKETRKRMSKAKSGVNNPMFGLKRGDHSEFMKGDNHPVAGKNAKKVFCEHCNKEYFSTTFGRFHKENRCDMWIANTIG